jgi:Ni/Co efflux regulator RcnB
MKKTLLALTAATLLAGASAASAQSAYYYDSYGNRVYTSTYRDYDRDGVPNRYDRYDDRAGAQVIRYDRYGNRIYTNTSRQLYNDRDCDGVPNRYDTNDRRNYRDRDCDGVPNGYDLYDDRGYTATRMYTAPRYYAPRGYTYSRWDVGTRLPYGYYGSNYYIDYRPYGLAAPPYGYRWNRVGSDAYLIDTTSGLIAEVVYSLFR